MPEDYQTIVLAKYRKLTEEEKTSIGLSTLTRASIRKACIKKFNEQYRSEDDYIFAEFFDVDRIDANFSQLLNKSDADDFKAIHNHIVGNNKTDNTDLKNTELLAWLIDFNPRPSHRYYAIEREKERKETKELNGDVISTAEESDELDNELQNATEIIQSEGVIEIETDLSDKIIVPNESKNINHVAEAPAFINTFGEVPIVQENTPVKLLGGPQKEIKKLNFLQRTGIVATLGLIMGVAYWKGVPPSECMYWTGTEYKAVACDAQIPNTQILALNQHKLDNFKKITLPDTMTFNSLTKVWYSKIDNEVEFFTAKGKHPLKTERVLKPITIHILGKYGNNRILSLSHQTDTTEKD